MKTLKKIFFIVFLLGVVFMIGYFIFTGGSI